MHIHSLTRLRRKGPSIEPYLFLLPALVLYVVFMVYPMFQSLLISFTRWEGLETTRTFIGLQNYKTIFFDDPISRLALKNNLIWIVWTLLLPTAMGLGLAVALNQKLPGTVGFRTCFYAPAVIPLVAVGVMWSWLYNPHFGFLNELLRWLGLDSLTRSWLGDPNTALYWLLVASTWERVGFPMIFYLAGLQGIPQQLLEAAELDGAGPWSRFWHITMPLLRETHIIIIALQVIASFKTFDIIYTLTGGGPGRSTQVLATWMYFNAFQYHHNGLGAALAWVISAITMIVTFPYIRIMSRR